ncbi:MAG: CDP-diacylglycerol--serine O-phosphatidyltransferase [Muribaculaceae bacterium]|nr:CDP-diacylglycerol--serine O-phosphatidyltransferase [Muribaculaceae bacterium]
MTFLAKIKASIPNTITCCNLIAGSIACILSFSAFETLSCSLTGLQWAYIFIGIAALMDFLDGAMARALKAYSPMGKELDSLCDLVSFGLAPSLLLFNVVQHYAGPSLWAYCALFIAVIGALRLARFNIDDRQTTSFIGLPIPANAIFWIGYTAWISIHGFPGVATVLIIMFLEALLMVSNIKIFSLKFKNFNWRENFRRYVIILAAILFVITDGIPGLMWTIILYVLISAVARKNFE